MPGPACYGRGGTRPTVTDAHVVLGHLPDTLAGGLRVDASAAETALAPIATQLGLSARDAAEAVLAVADAELVRAVRLATIERGIDPRDHVLVAYGGAGPMHACRVAAALDIPRVLVPVASGVLCAAGAALGEARVDVARSVLRRVAGEMEADLEAEFADLEGRAREELAGTDVRLERAADLRLAGQAFEITVPHDSLEAAVEAFHAEHMRRYGFADRERALEVVTLRVAARGPAPEPGRPAPPDLPDVRGPAVVPLGEATRGRARGVGGRPRSRRGARPAQVRMSIELQVIGAALRGVAEEMGAALIRSAVSPNIKERRDCSTAVFDARGELVAQAAHIPVHLGAMPAAVSVAAALDPEPGDVIWLNDPFAGGTHLPDMTLVAPVDSGGRRLGYTASRAHWADVGGIAPGSMPAASRRLRDEGLILPPLHLARGGGEPDARLIALVLANTRRADERAADLRAQLACHGVAADRLSRACGALRRRRARRCRRCSRSTRPSAPRGRRSESCRTAATRLRVCSRVMARTRLISPFTRV